MCDAQTIAGMKLGGAGLQAGAQYNAGQAASDVAEYNAAAAQIAARDAKARGEEAVFEKRREARQIIGAQRAAFAGQGVAIDRGTPLAVTVDTARMGELDAMRLRNNAAREAHGYKVKKKGYEYQAKLAAASGFGNALGAAARRGDFYYMDALKFPTIGS